MRYLSELVFVGEQGGGISQSPQQKSAIPKFDIPFLAGGKIGSWTSPDILGWFEDKRWFLLGDLGGIAKGVTSGLSWATVIGLVLVFVTWYFLWRTKVGLRLRSSGEAPEAAESLGVKVFRVRYLGLALSGGFAGLGGAYLSIISSSYYRQGQTANRGFIGIATMIFGNWRPAGLLGGAGLFGFSEALKLRREDSLPALFLFVAFVGALLIVVGWMRKNLITSVTATLVAAAFFVAYLTVEKPAESLTQATPYLVTIIVLATASQRLRPPAHAGQPYP
jgi:simple sugar transport system permease protein